MPWRHCAVLGQLLERHEAYAPAVATRRAKEKAPVFGYGRKRRHSHQHATPPVFAETPGAAAVLQPHGRRGRLYVRGFLRIGSTEPLLLPKMTMEMGVHRVHGRSDGAACGDDPV